MRNGERKSCCLEPSQVNWGYNMSIQVWEEEEVQEVVEDEGTAAVRAVLAAAAAASTWVALHLAFAAVIL